MRRHGERKLGPWEQAHRPYTLRVTSEQRDRIEALRKEMSLQRVLEKGLTLLEHDRRSYQNGYNYGKRVGETTGYERGKAEWRGKFDVVCSKCGKSMTVDFYKHDNIKEAVTNALKTFFHGGSCPTS